MEDLSDGQRIANYTIEFERASEPGAWQMLVPAGGDQLHAAGNPSLAGGDPLHAPARSLLRDPVSGHFPRDQHVGHKRIDVPSVTLPADVSAVRFSCIRAYAEPVALRSFSLHQKCVEWEGACEHVRHPKLRSGIPNSSR